MEKQVDTTDAETGKKTTGGARQCPLKNRKTGMVASVSNRSLGKMTSESASRKSGFPKVHALAVANLDYLFEAAKKTGDPVPDRKNDPNIKAIHRFDVPVTFGSSLFSVNIMVKEIVNPKGNNVYTIDIVKIKSDPAGLLKVADTGKTGLMAFPLAGSTNDNIISQEKSKSGGAGYSSGDMPVQELGDREWPRNDAPIPSAAQTGSGREARSFSGRTGRGTRHIRRPGWR